MAHAECLGQFIKGNDGWVALTPFQIAHVLLAETRLLGKFFLSETTLTTQASYVPANQFPHIHTRTDCRSGAFGLSPIICIVVQGATKMFKKFRSLLGSKAETPNAVEPDIVDKEEINNSEQETERPVDPDSSLMAGAVSVAVYGMLVSNRKYDLVKERLGIAVIAISDATGLNREQALAAVMNFAEKMCETLVNDNDKRKEFIKNFERTMSDIDFNIPDKEYDDRDFFDDLPIEYRQALNKKMVFKEWQDLLSMLSPFQVSTIANAALTEPQPPACSQLHFWNAVIDHLISTAFLALDMDNDSRVASFKMAEKYKALVRVGFGESPEIIKQCEEAWDYTIERGSKLQESRVILFEHGKINKWGIEI